MWKRNAIFLICKLICEKGINPDEIAGLFDWRGNIWFSVDGLLNAVDFDKRASEQVLSGGLNFDRRRWFCDDDELVHANGKTYVFSNQWGGSNWHRAMNLLKDKYPQYKIAFSPAS